MKKILAACLTALLLLGTVGCAAEPVETTVPAAAAETAPVPVDTAPEETETPSEPDQGVLLLSVSMITFPLVGQQEDIYTGTALREHILWESDNPSVAIFEDGVITAVGVGKTVIRASFEEQTLECEVRCLASDEEELENVTQEVLHSANRLPQPADPNEQCTFFDDAAFVGDSISYTLEHRAPVTGVIGNPTYLVRGGVSLYGFILGSKRITLRGHEIDLEDAIAQSGVRKVFIMMGQNDLSYRSVEQTIETWAELLSRIREKNPDVEIYIQSLVPEWQDHYQPNDKNEKIQTYNEELKIFAQDNGCHYVEVAAYFKDNTNRMPNEYTSDHTIHINFTGADVWMQVLRAYVRELQAKGEA